MGLSEDPSVYLQSSLQSALFTQRGGGLVEASGHAGVWVFFIKLYDLKYKYSHTPLATMIKDVQLTIVIWVLS